MKKQERKKRREVLRPSPNEEATILQSDKEKRKKLRLKQVREQEKAFSRKLLEDVRKRKTVEAKHLASHLKSQWENEQNLKWSVLERKYQENLAEIGLAHQTASEDQTSYTKPELSEEEKHRASERYKKALEQLMYDRAKSTQSERERAEARQQALETERLRAAKIAALPPPKDPIADLYLRKGQKTHEQNVDSFSTTRFHLHPSVHVERDLDPNQKDAGQVALDEEERLQMLLEDAQRNKVEQTEKARLRHKHALEMLQLEEDHKKLMEELGQLERHDRQRRQEAVAKIPVRIFQPPHKRLEDAEDRQRDLEQAFEDMYMMQTGYTGDLTVALEPPENLMTAVSEDSATSASDIDRRSVESDEARGAPSAVRPGRRPESDGHRSEPEKETEEALPRDNVPKAQTEDPLRRLLQRIERQRDQWKRRQLIEEPQPTAAASTDIPRTLPSTKPSSEDQGYRVPETIPFSTSPESLAEAELSGEEADGSEHAVDAADEPRPEDMLGPVVSDAPHPPMDGIRTLLHPLEAAQRSRTTTPSERAVTHQEALLEQQKLKLKLQQQTLLQQQLEQQIQDYQRQLADIYGTTGAQAGPLPSRTLRAPDEHMPLEEPFPSGAPYEGVASLEDFGPRSGQTSQALPTVVPTITSHEGSPLMSDVLESSTLSSATSNETEAALPSEFERTLAAARATADRAAEMRQRERDVLQELSRAALEDVPFSSHTHSERDASPRSTPTLQSQELVNISTPSTLSLSVTLSSDLSVTAAASHTVTSRFSDHALHSSSQPRRIPFPNVGDTASVTATTSLLTKTSQYLGLSREPSSNIRSFPVLTSGSDVQTRFSVVTPSSVSSIRAVTEPSWVNPLTFAPTSLSGGATAVSHSSASQLASLVYSTGYLDYYKQKIEEERQLFEAQRKRIRRYSDKFKSSSYESPGSQTYKAPVISSTNAPQSEPHLSSPFLSNLRGDDAGVLGLDQNKENQGLIANSVGIRGQDRLRDISQRLNTLEKTLTTNSSSIAVTSASYTSKPGSTSGWSYGSSTEYLSLPRNTAGRHFLGSAGSTLSSLSELTEMMTRLTSTSDESDDKSLRAGARSGPLSVMSKGPLDVAHSHAPKEPSAEFSSANGPAGILSGSRWTRGSDGKPWYVLSRSSTLPSAGTLGRDAVLPEMEEEDNVFPEVTGYKSPLSGSEETGSTTSVRLGTAEKLDDSSSASGVNALMSSTISSASSGSLADSPKVSDVQADSSSLSSTGK